jgi:transcriptional regulator of acetoin/glycerol metabolism
MWKTALAGAVALATIGSLSFSHGGFGIPSAAAQEVVVTEGQIARLHAALHLTAAQERHWHAVAATLRSLGRQQAQYRVASTGSGLVTQAKSRVAGYAVTAMTMQRLRAVATPLVNELTEEQKQAGRNVLAAMGVSF